MKRDTFLKQIITPLLGASLMLGLASTASASYTQRKDVQAFMQQMHKEHHFDLKQMQAWLSEVVQQKTALEAIARPAEGKPWKDYRNIFITQKRIDKGVEFWKENASLLAQAEKKYGVPAEYIVAIIGVETYYGKHAGNYRVLDALTTLGFDYPIENTTKERRDRRERFFRKELVQFLLMSREEKFDPRELKGSYAGAMGMPQFIPSSFRSYAVDFDGNGVRDFWNSSADPIGSVANYFKVHGWKPGAPVVSPASVKKPANGLGSKRIKSNRKTWKTVGDYSRLGVNTADKLSAKERSTLLKLEGAQGDEYWLALHNFYVITRYNHSPLYALAVHQLSQEVSKKYHAQ